MPAPRLFLTLFVLLATASCTVAPPHAEFVTISVVGINDIHGRLGAGETNGGLVAISAYIDALRHARAADGGGIVVVDAGDMWQGTLESNLSEGTHVVAAYNALGVTAATIGNHEFDFGPSGPGAIPMSDDDDPRGALRQRATEANFPLLVANLIDDATGLPVAWDNVQPSILVDAGGVPVGIIGVTTRNALITTIPANTTGLSVAPLAETVAREARRLRADGAALVIVAAHAGGYCGDASDPNDASSCDPASELVALANDLEPGLVDHIFGGHLDHEITHVINGISVSVNLSRAASFGRVDFSVDPASGDVANRELFPLRQNSVSLPDHYAGQALEPVAGVEQAAAVAAQLAAEQKGRRLGVTLAEPFARSNDMESALFNLVTEALLESFDADVAILNVRGGLRDGLPAGELTFGDVYEMFPFDNVASLHEFSGRELREVIARQARRSQRAGFAGMRVFASCDGGHMRVRMLRDNGSEILDTDRVTLLANDFLAMGGDDILEPVAPAGEYRPDPDHPRIRDVLVNWLEEHGGTIHPADWRSHDAPKWNPAEALPADCVL